MAEGENESRSLDVLGIKSFGDTAKILTEGTINAANALLSRICLPAAEELGLLFRDRISHWRAIQAAKIVEKADKKLQSQPDFEQKHAHPRIVGAILEHGSWMDTDYVQEMWAGLLVSSCNEDGKDESNLMFVNLLAQLTASQAKMLSYGCEHVSKYVSESGLITTVEGVYVTRKELATISGTDDLHRLDRELDHLRALELLKTGMYWNPFLPPLIPRDLMRGLVGELGELDTPIPEGFDPDQLKQADVAATALGVQLYVRCQGSTMSPAEYFGLKYEPPE